MFSENETRCLNQDVSRDNERSIRQIFLLRKHEITFRTTIVLQVKIHKKPKTAVVSYPVYLDSFYLQLIK